MTLAYFKLKYPAQGIVIFEMETHAKILYQYLASI